MPRKERFSMINIEAAVTAYRSGMSLRGCGEKLGIARSTMRRLIALNAPELLVEPGKIIKDRRRNRRVAIKDYYLTGKTMMECAAHFGTSEATVCRALDRFPEVERRPSSYRALPEEIPTIRFGSPRSVPTEIISDEPKNEFLTLIKFRDRNVIVPNETLAYVAGLFDGEGCVYSADIRGDMLVRAVIANTNRQVLEFVQSIFGGGIYEVKRPNDRWKDAYRLHFNGRLAVTFLGAIHPWLRIKADQALVAFAWAALKDGALGDDDLAPCYGLLEDQLSWLNKRGPNSEIEPIKLALQEVADAS